MLWEFILTAVTAIGSVAGSVIAIRTIIKHELKLCDERMEAFKEGLKYGEKSN